VVWGTKHYMLLRSVSVAMVGFRMLVSPHFLNLYRWKCCVPYVSFSTCSEPIKIDAVVFCVLVTWVRNVVLWCLVGIVASRHCTHCGRALYALYVFVGLEFQSL
jgi:hypothetical protein